jgi:2-polyprenyl-3-methyl-5-hydroxy-6-metoxy-1,4-benzoquinol methylase
MGEENYNGLAEKAIKKIPALAKMDRDYIKEIMESFWYHKIHLGQGVYTPGTYNMAGYLKNYPMPRNMRGKTVLEIGAADGFFSLKMAKRGADVTAIDIDHMAVSHMRFLREFFGICFSALQANIFTSESLKLLGTYDYVWATNFMQHVKPGHPINNHTKEEFIEIMKRYVKPDGVIVCASDQPADLALLTGSFRDVKVVSQFKHVGFKVRTQTHHEQNLFVAEVRI